jgi:hypothetical protein
MPVYTNFLASFSSVAFMCAPHGFLAVHYEKITSVKRRKGRSKVLLTNSARRKPGPKGTDAGAIYSFAHQAYWAFTFLSIKQKSLWEKVLLARKPRKVQEVGKECSKPGVMAGAGYGATGLMTWLKKPNVAVQVLAAKNHRRYPRSERPSSQDRRMIFLGIAVAAGVFDIKFSTALRKLAQSGRGEKHLSQAVHNWDRIEQRLKEAAFVWAEPISNYCDHWPDGGWRLRENLPCRVPENYQGGYIIHGFGSSGAESTFSRTLPLELRDVAVEKSSTKTVEKNEVPKPEGSKIKK